MNALLLVGAKLPEGLRLAQLVENRRESAGDGPACASHFGPSRLVQFADGPNDCFCCLYGIDGSLALMCGSILSIN